MLNKICGTINGAILGKNTQNPKTNFGPSDFVM